MQLDAEQLILGRVFLSRVWDDAEVLREDHEHNLALIRSVFPDYADTLPDPHNWQGRASIRAQSQDYFPLLGALETGQQIYSLSGLGSKGFSVCTAM